MSNAPSIRAFVAVELSREVKEALARVVDSVQAAGAQGVRTVDPQGIHLTIKFLGSIRPVQVETVAAALRRAVQGETPFQLELGEAGVFPPRGRARVLWVGLRGQLGPLATLHARVERALEPLGFLRDPRPYSPHLTVARVKAQAADEDVRRAVQALMSAAIPHTKVTVEAVSLVQSILRPEGPLYRPLALAPLGGAS